MIRIGVIGRSSKHPPEEYIQGDLPHQVSLVSWIALADINQNGGREALRNSKPDIVLIDSSVNDSLPSQIARVKETLPKAWILTAGPKPDSSLLIQAVQAGARDFLPKPVTPDLLGAVLRRYYAENPSALMAPGRLIAVTSPKGGCGSTCVAINLAAAISQIPDTRVSLVDFGTPLGDTAAYLGLKPSYSLIDALNAEERLDSTLLHSFMTPKGNLNVLTGSAEFKTALQGPERSVIRLLEVLSRGYTETVLDLSLHLPALLLAQILRRVDEILVVIAAEIPAVWSALRLLYHLEDLKKAGEIRLILNRSVTSAQIRAKDIENLLEHKIYHSLPNNYRAMSNAVNSGQPLVELDRSNLSQSFKVLAEMLTGLKQNSKKRMFQFFS